MAGISPSDFFRQTRSQSEVKSEIMSEYFKTWASILLRGQRFIPIQNLLYLDLYAGKGYYDDNKPSTPIKVLNSIHADVLFNEKIKTFFNDDDDEIVHALDQNIRNLPFYDNLKHKPAVLNQSANKELLRELLSKENQNPSLTFIDPLGYKGVSAELCLMAVKNWGSDLFLLFNLNRIRPGIKNSGVEHLMRDLFAERFEGVVKQYDKLNVEAREEFIVDEFIAHFTERKYRTLKFKVEFEDKNSTSHYLLFVSKVDIAYLRMKEIMSKYSDRQTDGVPWFAVNNSRIQNLFSSHSIQNLKSDLLMCSHYHGKTIEEIYATHNFNTPYIKENYKTAIGELLNEFPNKIRAAAPIGRQRRTLTYQTVINYL